MRVLVYGVVVAAMIAGGCDRVEQQSSASGAAEAAAPDATGTASSDPSTREPAGAPEPEFREFTIPAGTRLPITLDTAISSDTSRVEQRVDAHTTTAITVDDVTVVPAGSVVSGVVTEAQESGKVKGRAHLAVRFDTLIPEGTGFGDERYTIQTRDVARTAAATKKEDAMKIGAPAAGGAIVGAIIGGKKGAAIGTAVGGGAGAAVVLSTSGKEVRLGKGAALTLQLAEPLTVRIRQAR